MTPGAAHAPGIIGALDAAIAATQQLADLHRARVEVMRAALPVQAEIWPTAPARAAGTVERWLHEVARPTDHPSTPLADLYDDYSRWCRANGHRSFAYHKFAARLRTYGIDAVRRQERGERAMLFALVTGPARLHHADAAARLRPKDTHAEAVAHNGEVMTFTFGALDFRALSLDGDPWFVATDVCGVLGIANTTRAVAGLDDDEKGLHAVKTLGGEQRVNVISESGMYRLIMRSRKPDAQAFVKIVTKEVLPAIRRRGFYAAPGADAAERTRDAYRVERDEARADLAAVMDERDRFRAELSRLRHVDGDTETLDALALVFGGAEFTSADVVTMALTSPTHPLRRLAAGSRYSVGRRLVRLARGARLTRVRRGRSGVHWRVEASVSALPA